MQNLVKRPNYLLKSCLYQIHVAFLGKLPRFIQLVYINYFFLTQNKMKKVNKQCLLDTPRTVRVREKILKVIVQTSRP